MLFELHFTLQPYIIFYIVVNGLERKKHIVVRLYGVKYLHCVLLQVVRLPESHVLDVVWQTAATVVSVIKDRSLQVAVQNVDPERRATPVMTMTMVLTGRLAEDQQECVSPFGKIFDTPIFLCLLPARLGHILTADFIGHVAAVVLSVALQSSVNTSTWWTRQIGMKM